MKKWLWSVALILSFFVAVYLARVPLSLWVVKQFVPVEALQVSCLDWRLSGVNRIHIRKACVQSDAFNVQIYDAQVNMQQIDIASVALQLRSSKSTDSAKPQRLSLPVNITRPRVNIARVTLSGKPLPSPLNIAVTEPTLNQFEVAGDITASLALHPAELVAKIELGGEYLSALLPTQVRGLAGHSELQFDGLTLNTLTELEALVAMEHTRCEGTAAYIGTVTAEYDLSSQQGQLLVNTPISVNTALHCLPAEYQQLLPASWQLSVQDKISISPTTITTPEIVIAAENKALQLSAKNLAINLPAHSAVGDVQLQLSDEKLGQHALSATFKVQPNLIDMRGELTSGLSKLTRVNMLTADNVELTSHFKLFGDPNDVLTIDASPRLLSSQLSMQGLVFNNPAIKLDVAAQLDITKLQSGDRVHNTIPEGISFTAQLDSQLPRLDFASGSIKESALQGSATLNTAQEFDISIALTAKQIRQGDHQVNQLAQQFKWQGNVAAGEIFSTLEGQTQIANVVLPKLSLNNIEVISKGQQNRGVIASHSITMDGIKMLVEHQYSSLKHPITVRLPTQQLDTLQPYLEQLLPTLKVTGGRYFATLEGDLSTRIFSVNAGLREGAALFNERLVQNAKVDVSGLISSANIQLIPTTLSVEELRAGVVVQKIKANLFSEAGVAKLTDIRANVFAGQVTIAEVNLVPTPQVVQVGLDKLSLDLIAESGHDAGVELRGLISGRLPVQVSSSGVKIESGKVHNVGEGLLKVENNASINALKEEQPSLQTVIGVLDELTIEQLNSDVSLSEEGWLDLDVKITGINKLQQQPVNFNYTHSENVFTLLRALRLSDEITREVEKALK
ncbi:intermembrane phospholipid transport protein YdbH family protein [Pseudoalteromonas piscicida]|uniref:intermembrane phospholipid transport protein YdbH family protein n=1 Tax=Pseudoalteromonas piscicida TaxID=43662 RepID=UPI0030AF00FD